MSAITLGLLMPHPEAQAAAQDALQTLDLQPGAAADAPLQTLAAVLLSKHLWPLAARAPAYPTLTRALLARPALLPGTTRALNRVFCRNDAQCVLAWHACMQIWRKGLLLQMGCGVLQGMAQMGRVPAARARPGAPCWRPQLQWRLPGMARMPTQPP